VILTLFGTALALYAHNALDGEVPLRPVRAHATAAAAMA
jgi:hypothetical protein